MRVVLLLLICVISDEAVALPDHHELEATLNVRATGDGAELLIESSFPGAPSGTRTYWRLSITYLSGHQVDLLTGELELSAEQRSSVHGMAAISHLAPGFYTLELSATAIEPWLQSRLRGTEQAARVTAALQQAPNGVVAYFAPS